MRSGNANEHLRVWLPAGSGSHDHRIHDRPGSAASAELSRALNSNYNTTGKLEHNTVSNVRSIRNRPGPIGM